MKTKTIEQNLYTSLDCHIKLFKALELSKSSESTDDFIKIVNDMYGWDINDYSLVLRQLKDDGLIEEYSPLGPKPYITKLGYEVEKIFNNEAVLETAHDITNYGFILSIKTLLEIDEQLTTAAIKERINQKYATSSTSSSIGASCGSCSASGMSGGSATGKQ